MNISEIMKPVLKSLDNLIDSGELEQFMNDAYEKDIVVVNYADLVKSGGMKGKVYEPSDEDLKALSSEQILGCISWHFRNDHYNIGALIRHSIAEGHMLRMMKAYIEKEDKNYAARMD